MGLYPYIAMFLLIALALSKSQASKINALPPTMQAVVFVGVALISLSLLWLACWDSNRMSRKGKRE